MTYTQNSFSFRSGVLKLERRALSILSYNKNDSPQLQLARVLESFGLDESDVVSKSCVYD